jgi:hypothetical protein
MLLLADMAASCPVRFSRGESGVEQKQRNVGRRPENIASVGCEVIALPRLEVTLRVRVGVCPRHRML